MAAAVVGDLWVAASYVIDALDQPPAPPPDESVFYGWHPLPLSEWARGMAAARDYLVERNKYWSGAESFLDVGSATGTKLALAHQLGWQHVEGVERHEPFADLSRRRWPAYPVAVCDAEDFDRYHEFDLVYSYRLCVDLDRQAELTATIVSRMRPGALLFLAGGPDPVGLEHVGESVWRT